MESSKTRTHPFARCHSAEDEEELASTLSPFIPRTSSNVLETDVFPALLAALIQGPRCPSELEQLPIELLSPAIDAFACEAIMCRGSAPSRPTPSKPGFGTASGAPAFAVARAVSSSLVTRTPTTSRAICCTTWSGGGSSISSSSPSASPPAQFAQPMPCGCAYGSGGGRLYSPASSVGGGMVHNVFQSVMGAKNGWFLMSGAVSRFAGSFT